MTARNRRLEIGDGLAMAMRTVEQAMENMEYVRRLLRQKQPGFAVSLELAAAQLERKLREPGMAPQNRRHARCPAAGFASRAAVKRAMAWNIQNAELQEGRAIWQTSCRARPSLSSPQMAWSGWNFSSPGRQFRPPVQ